MKVSIALMGAKAFSINKTYSRDMRFKSSEYKDWFIRTKTTIEEHEAYKELLDMAGDFNVLGGEFSVHMEVVYPSWLYYNKSGQISAKTFDCSNVEKVLIDLLFGDIMNVNDRNITRLVSTKRAGANFALNVTLELHSNKSA